MSKLIPKYQKGTWRRVIIDNETNEPGYIDVDDNGRPWDWDEKTNMFKVYRGYPGSNNFFWTTVSENNSNRNLVPQHNLTPRHKKPKNRKEIRENKEIDEDNKLASLWWTTPDDILREYQLRNQQGSAHRVWYDSVGKPHYEFGERGMSGTDPLGKFYVESVALGKGLQGVNNLIKSYRLNNSLNKQFDNFVDSPDVLHELKVVNPNRHSFFRTEAKKVYDEDVPDIVKTWTIPDNREATFGRYTIIGTGQMSDRGKYYVNNIIGERLNKLGVPQVDSSGTFRYFTPSGTMITYKNLQNLLQENANKPVYFGFDPSPNANLGTYYRNEDTAVINLGYYPLPEDIVKTMLHERGMHGTDQLIRQLGYMKLYQNFIDKLTNGLNIDGEKVILDDPEYPIYISKNALRPEELRATTGEYNLEHFQSELDNYDISKLSEEELSRGVVGDPSPYYIMNENNRLLNDDIVKLNNNTSDEEILNRLEDINNYGSTYKQLILAHTPEKRAELMKDLRWLLNYAPSVIGTGMVTNQIKK